MSRFARLFHGLMMWSFDGWWSLTVPMTEREWELYYVHEEDSDHIMVGADASDEDIEEALAQRAVAARAPPSEKRRAKAIDRVWDRARERLALGCQES